jgi:magnesium-transporting ATPase (P-type)
MQDLKSYLISPKYIKQKNINWIHFFKVFLFCFLLSVILSGVTYSLQEYFHVNHKRPSPNLQMTLQAILWTPFIEEVWFRLLLKPSNRNLRYFIILNSLGLIYLLYKETFVIVAIILLLMGIVACGLIYRKKIGSYLLRKCLRNFPVIYYFIAILFGLVHLINFQYVALEFWMYSLLPVLVMSQVTLGVFLGYIRMKYGVLYSILFHAINNLIPFLPFIYNSL